MGLEKPWKNPLRLWWFAWHPPSIKALATTKDFLEASVLQLPDRDASLRDFAVPWSGGMMQLVAMKKRAPGFNACFWFP